MDGFMRVTVFSSHSSLVLSLQGIHTTAATATLQHNQHNHQDKTRQDKTRQEQIIPSRRPFELTCLLVSEHSCRVHVLLGTSSFVSEPVLVLPLQRL
jgi:hypothetical protein